MSHPPHGQIRLATASPSTHPSGVTKTLEQLESIASRAAADNADILLLPEAYLGGYPRGSGFGAVVGSRTDEGREEYRKYFRGAVDLGDITGNGAGGGDRWVRRELGGQPNGSERTTRGDGTREELERIASQTGLFIVTGLIERAGGSLYCAAVYVDPARGMLGKRRKVMPSGSERLIWAQGSPATLCAVSTTIRGVRINLAAAICWESFMPLLRQTLYAQNINLYLAPTADGDDVWTRLIGTIGTEGKCFVVSSNMAVQRLHNSSKTAVSAITEVVSDEEKEGGSGNQNDWISRGGSLIAGPFGDIIAGPQWEDAEGILYADVDFEDCVRGRLDIDAGGSYSRNDSFKFSVEGLDLQPLPY